MTKSIPTPAHRKFGLLLLGSLLAVSMAACSGAETTSESPESAQAELSAPAKGAGPRHGKGPRGEHGRHGPKDPAQLIAHFDANKDGKLAVAELPEKMQEHIGAADADKDGFLTAEEIKAGREQQMQERGKKHFARMDKNSDGFLSADEVGEKRWERIKVADADNDARVSAEELKQAHEAGKLAPPQGRHGGEFRHHGPDADDDE